VPAGTGKSHVLVSLGVAAVRAGRKVRYFTAADLADAFYRGLADNSVGKVIEPAPQRPHPPRRSRVPPSKTPAPSGCSGSSPPPANAAPPGIASRWPFDQRGRFLPEHTTVVSLLDNRLLRHASVVVTSGDSYRMRQARAKGGTPLKTN
jgi:DNA replication protein DnaC